MTAWGNRYSALSQEPPIIKSTPTLPSTVSKPFSPNQTSEYSPVSPRSFTRARYPPNSSVFVASLPFCISPEEMHGKLTRLICQFIEPIEVKIIKDKLGNQAAFVQAKNNEDAKRLLNSHLFLDGKVLRLELAHAHRALVVSFKDLLGPPPTLRLLRNPHGYLRAIVNEVTPIEGWIPLHKDDQFSGPGYLIPNFAYNETSLRKLCELFGPIEEFKRVDPSVKGHFATGEINGSPPHALLPQGNPPLSELWEIKWLAREDAMLAKSILTTLPFINWNWAHNFGQTEAPFRANFRPYDGAHSRQFTSYHSTFKHAPNNINAVQGSVTEVEKNSYASKPQSLKLGLDEFPPLAIGHSLQTSQKRPSKHERTVSEDTDTPITPESLHHASPEIANVIGEVESVGLNYLEMSPDKVTPVAPTVHPQSERMMEANGTYDKSTLYVSSVPHNANESEVKQLFTGYGHIKKIRLIPNIRGEYASAFINFDTDENATKAMEAAHDKPFTIGCTKLRVRYKRLYPTGRPRGRGRFPGLPGRDRSSKQGGELLVDKLQDLNVQEVTPQEVVAPKEVADENQTDNEQNPSIAKAFVAPAESKRGGFAEEFVVEESCNPSETTNANAQIVTEVQPPVSKIPAGEVPSGVPTPLVDAYPSTESMAAKPPYYGYYGPSSFPANYHPHWGYPYPPMYPPMYPVHPYGHSYWYHPAAVPLPPPGYASPHGPGSKVEAVNGINPGPAFHSAVEQPSSAPTHPPVPPVAPAGAYQNPDGGITYVYPTEVIEKYMKVPPKAGERDAVDSRGTPESSQLNGSASGQYLHGTTHPSTIIPSQIPPHYPHYATDLTRFYDVNPAIAAAVYRNHPPLPPPPADKMPQGSFVFNSQGVVQHVEPAAYAPGGQPGGQAGPVSENGLGLVQAAAAVMAHGYHSPPYPSPMGLSLSNQDAASELQSASSRYSSPVSASGPYYYPQNMYHPAFSQMGSGTHAQLEYPSSDFPGARGGYKRRPNHVVPRMYPVSGTGPGGDFVNGNHYGGQAV